MKAAVSRLKWTPPVGEMKFDLKAGTLELIPAQSEGVNVRELARAIEEAGYAVRSVEIAVSGRLTRRDGSLALEAPGGKPTFLLRGEEKLGQLETVFREGRSEVRVIGPMDLRPGPFGAILVKEFQLR